MKTELCLFTFFIFCAWVPAQASANRAKTNDGQFHFAHVQNEYEERCCRFISDKTSEIDRYVESRIKHLDSITEREIDFLTNKINFLGLLLAFAGVVAVFVPVYASFKIRRSWENSRSALERANAALEKAEHAECGILRTRGMQNFVNSKNCFRQYTALSGRFDYPFETKPNKNSIGALFEGVEELRVNFMTQAITYIERAIAYNAEAGSGKAVRANLAMLDFYIKKIELSPADKNTLRRRLRSLKWTHSVAEIEFLIFESNLDDITKEKLVAAYASASSSYGYVCRA